MGVKWFQLHSYKRKDDLPCFWKQNAAPAGAWKLVPIAKDIRNKMIIKVVRATKNSFKFDKKKLSHDNRLVPYILIERSIHVIAILDPITSMG